MSDPYNVHIRTTGDPSGAELTQDALEQTAQAGEKIVDAATKGDRAMSGFVGKLKQLTPESLDRVEREFRQLIAAEEAAGRETTQLRAQLQALDNVKLDKVSRQTSGIFSGVLAANAVSSATSAIRNHIRASVELADQLDDLAGRAGVSAEALQTIGNVASRNNGSIHGTADALSKVQISAQAALGGSKPLLEMFERLGITTTDLKSLSPDQLFYKISEAVSTSSDRGRTYADVVGVMGKSSKDLFTTMELGPEKIQALGKAMGVFNKETTTALAEANDALEKFQNTLTVAAGKSIAALADWKKHGTDTLANSFYELFGLFNEGEVDVSAFVAVQDRAADSAEKLKAKSSAAANAVDDLGDSAEGATIDLQNLEAVERQFFARALAKLPLAEQLKKLREEIDRVRTEAGTAIPGLKFADSNALFALSKTAGLTDEARRKVIALALEYAALEDRVKQTAEADQKLQPERVKRIDEIRVALEKPNIPLVDRKKLLEEELRLLGEIKLAAEARAKSDAGATPPAGPKPLSDPGSLTQSLDKLEIKSQTEPLSRSLDVLQAQVDNQARDLTSVIEQIPSAVGEIPKATQLGFADISVALKLVPDAIRDAAAPMAEQVAGATVEINGEVGKVAQSIITLGGTVSTGFQIVDANINAVNNQLQRQIDRLAIRVRNTESGR